MNQEIEYVESPHTAEQYTEMKELLRVIVSSLKDLV